MVIGSIPAKATKADELLNLCISPISARIVAASLMEMAFGDGQLVVALIFYNFKEFIYWSILNVLRGEILFQNAHRGAQP